MFDINARPTPVLVTKRLKKVVAKYCSGEIIKAEKWNDFVYVHVKNSAGEITIVSIPFAPLG